MGKQNGKKNYVTFLVLESPNVFQIITFPTVLSVLLKNELVINVTLFLMGFLIMVYLLEKETQYFGGTKMPIRTFLVALVLTGITYALIATIPK
jgi:hypothetical protein